MHFSNVLFLLLTYSKWTKVDEDSSDLVAVGVNENAIDWAFNIGHQGYGLILIERDCDDAIIDLIRNSKDWSDLQ